MSMTTVPQIDDALLTTEEAANFLGVKPQTLALWRVNGAAKLPFIRIGPTVIRYSRRQLLDYLAQNTMTSIGGSRPAQSTIES